MRELIAFSLEDGWFQLLSICLIDGREYTIDRGSYAGQKRKQLAYTTMLFLEPGVRPLIPLPVVGIPPVATDEYLEEYLPYMMADTPPAPNELYTYGERIEPQMEAIIKRYRDHGFGSNQESIAVARPEDIHLEDPPCLRHIDTEIRNFGLRFYVYFRSWDLWGGFPVNMAAIRLMQEYMAESIGVEATQIIAASKGLHLYDHVWDVAGKLVGA